MGLIGVDTKMPQVIGHRGACGYAPENTLASIRAAVELEIQCVEFDVKLTKDFQPILFHDTFLGRTSNGRGQVSQYTLKELKALDVGSWYNSRFSGERIATLDEALEILVSRSIGAMIELKPSPGQETQTGQIVAKYLQKKWPETLPMPIIISFSEASLLAALNVTKKFSIGLNMRRIPFGWKKKLDSLGAKSLHCRHQYLTKTRAEEIIQTGMTLRCFTVNTVRRARTLASWGVHGVFSDFPDRML